MTDISIIVSTNASQVGAELEGLVTDVGNVAQKVESLRKTMGFLDRAFNKGRISAEIYSSEISRLDVEEDELYASIGKVNAAVKQQTSAMGGAASATSNVASATGRAAAATGRAAAVTSSAAVAAQNYANKQRMAGKATNKFGMYAQQVGYQVGDFFVQVQSGTDALVAFGQQGTQLAGLLPGLAGAVLGIGLALGTAIARAVMKSNDLTLSFKKMGEDLRSHLGSATPFINGIAKAFSAAGKSAYNTFTTMINNLDAVIAYSAALATVLAGKLVYGFIMAGRAGAAFFLILKRGLISTGIGILAVALGTIYLNFMKLVDGAGSFGAAFQLVKDVAKEALSRIGSAFDGLMWDMTAGWLNFKADGASGLAYVLDSGIYFANRFVGLFVGAIAAIISVWDNLPAAFKRVGAMAMNGLIDIIQDGINGVSEALNSFFEYFKLPPIPPIDLSSWKAAEGEAVNLASSAADAFSDAFKIDTFSNLSLSKGLKDYAKEARMVAGWATDFGDVFEAQSKRALKSVDALVAAVKKANGNSANIDPSDWIVPDLGDDDGGGGSSSSESKLAELLEEQRQRHELLKLSGRERKLKSEIFEITKALGDEAKLLSKEQILAIAEVNLALDGQETAYKKLQEGIQSIADTMSSSMSDAFMGMVEGTKSFKDAMKDMARAVIKQLFDILVVQRLVGSFDSKSGQKSGIVGSIMGAFGFANGGAFQGGSQIQAFANGGVVGGPTMFPINGGKTGLMGEAGPEAIMPLKRGANGKLGVEGGGGGAVNVVQNFNFSANGDESVKRIISQEAPKIAKLATSEIVKQRRQGGSMKAVFRG